MRAPRFTPWLLVATLTAAGAAAAAGYGLTAPKRYRATADILVAPLPATDTTFAGLDVLRDSSGRRTAAESAAALVRTAQVADAVRAQLGLRQTRDTLLHDLHVGVAHGSDVVLVTVEDTSATTAAQLANAFVDALLAQRTAAFQSQLASAIRRGTELLAGSSGAQGAELGRRLAVLRSFQGQPDPTIRRASTATAPTSASWPDLASLVLTGAGSGLAAAALLTLLLVVVRRRDPAYDRPMSSRGSRAAEELVDRLEQRLVAREQALAARERDLQAKIDELRDLEETSVEQQRDDAVLVEREAGLVEREQALAERERRLEERVAAVTKRELAVARAAAAKPEPPPPPAPAPAPVAAPPPAAPEPEAVPEPAPAQQPVAARDGRGAFNLTQLERLVAERGAAHPDRLDEWESYLYFLRDYASADGSIPSSFDALVEETFRPLL